VHLVGQDLVGFRVTAIDVDGFIDEAPVPCVS
jgi:hypothetical protein